MEIRKKAAFKLISQRLKVVGRSTPDIKFLVVSGLKETQLVAATCNRINEIDSLLKADVGIANGSTMTNEMLRDKSDIVLLNESLGSVLSAIKQGRTLYSNVRKFLQF